MKSRAARRIWIGCVALLLPAAVLALPDTREGTSDAPSAERGRRVLLTTALVPGPWPRHAYEELWKRWGLEERPSGFDRLVREQYGLHPAPFENGGLPMGLRAARGLFSGVPSAEETEGGQRVEATHLANDCLLCHAGSIAGTSVIGLGNSSLDLQALMEDLWARVGVEVGDAPTLSFQRGAIEATSSIHYLMRFRDKDLDRRFPVIAESGPPPLLEDIPAWWHLKRKKTMFHTGVVDSRAVRPFLTFMLSPTIPGEAIRASEARFADILAFVRTIEAPRYPFPVDEALADRGERVFAKTCARCHGTYGADGEYPNRFLPLEEIGTDPALAEETFRDGARNRHYLESWFAAETWDDTPVRSTPGYQAPPLDGIWATAPYLHNGSLPTVWHVLDSNSRPQAWTRTFRTGEEDFDQHRLGWVITEPACAPESERERRQVYDTNAPGRSNAGHEFGDELDDDERVALIEYLKTL